LGGAGGSKTCTACTIVKYQLTHMSQVATVDEPVSMANGHQSTCPYCKCDSCKDQWKVKSNADGSPGVITSWDFRKRGDCPNSRSSSKNRK
jgi:hypothetical protein